MEHTIYSAAYHRQHADTPVLFITQCEATVAQASGTGRSPAGPVHAGERCTALRASQLCSALCVALVSGTVVWSWGFVPAPPVQFPILENYFLSNSWAHILFFSSNITILKMYLIPMAEMELTENSIAVLMPDFLPKQPIT